MQEVLRPAFAALRWLNRSGSITPSPLDQVSTELEREVAALVALPVNPDHKWPAARCPACGGKPTAPSKYDPHPLLHEVPRCDHAGVEPTPFV